MMMKSMGVALSVVLLGLPGLSAGCGDEEKSGGSPAADAGGGNGGLPEPSADAGACDPDNLPTVPNTGIAYPNSYCGPQGCAAGGCDPLGRCQPACNAWAQLGVLSFQAVTMSDTPRPGSQPVPEGKEGDDVCPGKMVSTEGTPNCCQRGDNSKVAKPALKLTSLAMTQPVYFSTAPVEGVNRMAIEGDLYNWVTVLSGKADGSLTATSGNAVPNTDNTWSSVKGPFSISGVEFNPDGLWDAQTEIPAVLSTDGDGRKLVVGPTSSVKDYVMVMWIDDKYDFARLELHLRGVEWELPLDSDLNCAGERMPGKFAQVGKLKGFIPLDAAIDTEVWVARGSSQNLCTSLSGAADCTVPVAKWKPGS